VSETPEVVVFDLGGVLVEFAGFANLPGLLHGELSPEEVRRRWIASPAVSAFERGGLTGDEFAAAFAREWDLNVAPAVFVEQFADWALDFYPGARELVAAVRRAVPAACFSNSNPIHWEKNFRRFGIPQSFDYSFASFELGVVKPDAEAFELVASRLGCAPRRILFLDDTEVNVEGARRVGYQSHLVRGVAEARRLLASRGIVSPTE
jgi:putative hydrolase of the HAD superfamily